MADQTVETVNRGKSAPATVIAALAALGWLWAALLLTWREHWIVRYDVITLVKAETGALAFALLGAIAAGLVGREAALSVGRIIHRGTYWLLIALAIPVLDWLRGAGILGDPFAQATFLEPLLLALVSGAAAGRWCGDIVPRQSKLLESKRFWNAVVCGLVLWAVVWFYGQSVRAYDDYQLGFHDFGQFALRVISTWEGRGFLVEVSGLPAFWDHFNPGLALLSPLWGLWPDAKLFFMIQAVSLATPALFIFGIARRSGAQPAGAAAWAAAYLLYPAVAQMNLNFTYGWHPVSLSLPLLMLACWALLSGRRLLTIVAVVLAGSFKENIVLLMALMCMAMAMQRWLLDRRGDTPAAEVVGAGRFAAQLRARTWLIAGSILMVSFMLILKLAALTDYQTQRLFAHLGDTSWQVLLAPLLRPGALFNELFQARSAYFVLALAIPLGLGNLLRGRWLLAAMAMPLLVLLASNFASTTSIAFQYTTGLMPPLFMAAILGAHGRQRIARSVTAAGVAALVAGATLTMSIGALPWSGRTLSEVYYRSYGAIPAEAIRERHARRVGAPTNAILNEIVATIRQPEARVLATSRVAAHLLGIRRIDTIGHAYEHRALLQAEVGPDRSPLQLFDWIVIDTAERFQQTLQQSQEVIAAAEAEGFVKLRNERGIVLLRRPGARIQ